MVIASDTDCLAAVEDERDALQVEVDIAMSEIARLELSLAALAPEMTEVIRQRDYARNVLIGTARDMRGLAAFIEASFSEAVNPNAEIDSLAKALRNTEALLCDARREISVLKANNARVATSIM